jgi:hypothetical protein
MKTRLLSLIGLSTMLCGIASAQLSIVNYQKLSETRVDRTLFDYTFKADISNQGAAIDAATATVTSLSPSITVRSGTLSFSNIPANGSVTSSNTFVIRVDRTVAFSFSNLQWTFHIADPPQPPVANAGPPQNVALGATVHLDGSQSTASAGRSLQFLWSFVSRPAGSNATLSDVTQPMPTFVADRGGNYVVQLVVNDGFVSSAPATVTISTTVAPPVANAGNSQTALVGHSVTLNGTGSTDPNGLTLTYAWTFVSKPAGSSAALNASTSPMPTFSPDAPGDYVIQLIVNNGYQSSAPSQTTVSTNLAQPIANPGASQSVPSGTTVNLNGSGSVDPNGLPLTYAWSFTSKPAGSSAILNSPSSATPSFVADRPGPFVVQLTVSNGALNASATVTITDTIAPPVANPGAAQTVTVGSTATLNGSGSTDPNGLSLTYAWSFVSKPAGSNASLSSANTATPSFQANLPGNYIAQLTVNNGTLTNSATVTVTTNGVPPTANPGNNQSGTVGSTITLDGSGSTDPNGLTLSYAWSFVSKPATSNAVLVNANQAVSTFVIDQVGTYIVQLIVNDSQFTSTPAAVTISTTILAPTANAGPPQSVHVGDLVSLDGGGSSDPNGLSLTYLWSFASRPPGSTAASSNPTSKTPSFVVDKFGTYSVQLVVNNGTLSSTPATVLISTTAVPPVANAGPAQNVNTGAQVTLNGSASADPNGLPLTYSWSFNSKPAGSAAALVAANTSAPTFIADLEGAYIIQLTVNNGTFSSTATVTITAATASVMTITPGSASLDTLATAPFTVTINHPAGANGLTVSLSSDSGAASVPSTVSISQGATTADFTVATSTSSGPAVITATAAGYPNASANITVASRGVSFTSDGPIVGVGRSINGTITLAHPAPAAGVAIAIGTSNGHATVAPAIVTLAAGQTQSSFTITGVTTGSVDVTTSTGGFSGTPLTIQVTNNLISLGTPPSIGPGQSGSLAVSLSSAAPAGGVTISFTSSDTTVATVTATVFVPAGLLVPSSNPQITALTVGTAQIQASAPGFAPDSRTIFISESISFSPTTVNVSEGKTTNVTITASAPAPTGGTVLNLHIDDTTKATVPASVTIPVGQTSVPVTVTGVAHGSTTLHASGQGIVDTTAAITVVALQPLTLPNATVGKDLQISTTASLPAATPTNLTVTITSSDPSKVLLSTSPTVSGSASINLSVGAGSAATPLFYIQSLAASGTVTLTASGNGYGDGTAVVTLAQSGFYLVPTSLSTTTLSSDSTVAISVATLDANRQIVTAQPLRGGIAPVQVNVTSSDPTKGTIATSPVTFGANSSQGSTTFHPLAAGSTVITAGAPAGFTQVNIRDHLTADVTQPGIIMSAATIGKDLQLAYVVTLQTSQANPTTLTVTSLDPTKLLVSASPTVAGSSSAAIPVPANTTGVLVYVQALQSSGTAALKASTPGFADGQANITLGSSGFFLETVDFGTTTLSSDTTISISTGLMDSSRNLSSRQPLRAGMSSVSVNVASSDTSKGTITSSPVVFSGNVGNLTTKFHPIAAGSSTISIDVPAGFTAPSKTQQAIATITAPSLTMNSLTIGKDLQTSAAAFLGANAPQGGVSVTITSQDPTKLLLSTNPAVVGSDHVVVQVTSGSSTPLFYLQALQNSGTVTLALSAPGFANGSAVVTLASSAFAFTATSLSTTTISTDSLLQIFTYYVDANGTPITAQNLRGGLAPVNVVVASSDTNKGTIVDSPAVFSGNSGSASVHFHPLSAGSTILSIATPAGFGTAPSRNQVPVTITAPNIVVVSNVTVGKNLQTNVSVNLSNTPPAAVALTLTSSSGAVATLSTSATVAGSSSLTVPNVSNTSPINVYIQGMAIGSTTITIQAPGFNDATIQVNVVPSGFAFGQASVSATTSDVAVFVSAYTLDPVTQNIVTTQPLRGGFSATVPLSSSNSGVGTVPATVFLDTNIGTTSFPFHPVGSGSTTLTLGTPAGFATPSNRVQIPATVN